jgi:CheY-like chemotaxis protein
LFPIEDNGAARSSVALLEHGGEMDRRIRAFDCSNRPLAAASPRALVEPHRRRSRRGARFTMHLPLPDDDMPAEPTGDGIAQAKRPPAARILVADDNRDAASSLATLLSLDGHDVRVANDGAQALSAAEAFLPHIALLDIGMPKRNGYEVARAIRAAPWGASMVLVAVTGWGQSEDKRRAKEAGFDHHFTKPLDLDVLGAFVSDALARSPRD